MTSSIVRSYVHPSMYVHLTSIVLVYSIHLWCWTSMSWSIDTCQKKVSADKYHVTIPWAQANSSPWSAVFFFKFTADQLLISTGLQAQLRLTHQNINEASFFARFLWLDAATRSYYISYSSYTVNAFRVQIQNGLENVFFLHFSLVSIKFDISWYLWSTLAATQFFKSSTTVI